MPEQKVTLELSHEEALVLQVFLSRFNAQEHEALFEDQAEQRVLWDVECMLDQQVVMPRYDFDNVIAEAREKVRDKTDSG